MTTAPTAPPSRKGLQRKTKILESALDIIGRDGLAALSMRTLATEADLPLGAMGYYFANKKQLIKEAFDLHTQRELARAITTISSIAAAGTAADLARVLADFLIDGLENPQNAIVAEYEFLIESSRRDDLARASSAWLQSLQAQLVAVLTARGSSSPDDDARLILAVMAGLEVDNLSQGGLARARALAIRDSLDHLFAVLSRSWAASPADD